MPIDFVLFCKSYRRDFLRLKRLMVSLEKHNVDSIPFYISTPVEDRDVLFEVLKSHPNFHWVSDEDVAQSIPGFNNLRYSNMSGGLTQQIVKSGFWRLGLAENYLCVDSDSIFIKAFHKSDFMCSDGVPYTVLHQNKDFFQMAINRGHDRVKYDLSAESERVKSLFGRIGPNYYCAPAPFIWSAQVWRSLDVHYLQPKGINIWDVIAEEIPESLLYGETLLNFQAIPVRAIEPLFRVYNYDWEFFLLRRLGETEMKLSQNFLGVIYQSSWERELDYGASQKTLPSRTLKRFKRYLRFLQSYI
jgi:hypothetical protein